MKLIKSVEISYFRSLYKATFEDAGELNILFGRNDSGKSNFLRALNLFFNYETDVDREPDFDIDLSDTRRAEAQRGATRQFFTVRVHFNVPANYRKSLGKTIWLKKQWNRDGEVTYVYPRTITKGQKIQLTKFLGTIDFTYIPAIKDSDTFSRFVRRMYDAASESRPLERATLQFIDSIRSATSELSKSLAQTLGTITQLAAPNDMGDLFKSLDFSSGDDNHSLLLQKGDGIKVRHIPELLRYINDNESSYKSFIWGFEEPENSLDLGAAVAEAARFLEFARRSDTQIFITSHSPAFYLAGGNVDAPAVRRVFVSKQGLIDGKVAPAQAMRAIDTVDSAESVMGNASLHELPYVIKKLSDLQRDKRKLQEETQALNDQLREVTRPCLFVEGESEVTCLTPLVRQIKTNAVVRKLKGTPSTTSELLKRVFADGGSLSQNPTVFLFDFDTAGRAAFSNLTGSVAYSTPFKVTECITSFCIPTSIEFDDFLARYNIPVQRAFYPLEFMYSGEEAGALLFELMNEEQREEAAFRVREEYFNSLGQATLHSLRTATAGSSDWYWSRGIPNALKAKFFVQAKARQIPSAIESLVATIADRL